jgi:predicted metal-dependent phosphoesterase TrpH
MAVDLHVHTTASDGLWDPAEVVRAALELDLSVIAITDHDSVDGIDRALRAAEGTNLEVIPGVELSVMGPDGGDAHILGFFVDHRSPAFSHALETLRDARTARAELMVRRLREAGHALDFSHVSRHAGSGAVGRVHVARALVDAGSVDSVEQAFAELIGRQGPFYVHKTTLEAAEALSAIHAAGGVTVLAHPGVSGSSSLETLIAAGLDGIEAYHAEHTPAQVARYVELAASQGLLVTGGSDFHGPNMRSAMLGAGGCPPASVEALRERARILHP